MLKKISKVPIITVKGENAINNTSVKIKYRILANRNATLQMLNTNRINFERKQNLK
jgi:hypothetical protein